MNGYIGKILRVNLSTGLFSTLEFDETYAKRYLGGNGFAARMVQEEVPSSSPALSADNLIVFATGPFNESPVWGSSRGHCGAISPQTGFFADSNFGGDFASMLKKSGYDAVAITGAAPEPVYIMIDEGKCSLKKAADLWGRRTSETHAMLREREGAGIESAVIGPAGENLAAFACIICSGSRLSAAGRGGLGAVLGFKNCKALVVRGSAKTGIAEREKLTELLKSRLPVLRDNTKVLTDIGTPVLVKTVNGRGMLATRNNARETFDNWHSISGELILEQFKKKNVACHRCPVACGKLVSVPSGEFAGRDVKMPEFETIYAMGSMLENGDIVSIFNGNTLCDELGLDTISMGVTLAFAAECLEKGLISEQQFGAPLAFGNQAGMSKLILDTAYRRGPGELLSLGSEKMAGEIGGSARDYLYSVKGLEIAGHSARGIRSMGLAYATSTRGGSHHDARPKYPEPDLDPGFDGAPEYCVSSQNCTAVGDSLVMCRFLMERGFGTQVNDTLTEAVNLVTGFGLTPEDLSRIGERIYTCERLINTARGVRRDDDTLPHRVMTEPIPDGPARGRHCPKDELDTMLTRYYSLRGWDDNGIPTKEKIADLSL
jgi:aldehyde:ferredoxin oxidoreductase